MHQIMCFNKNRIVIDRLTQYDTNQVLYINWDYPDIPIFHFSNTESDKVLIVKGEIVGSMAKVNIPNILLTEAYPIEIYVYLEQENKTIFKLFIPVNKKDKPEDYKYFESNNYANFVRLEEKFKYRINKLNEDASIVLKDVVAPTVDVDKTGDTTTITFTDINGTKVLNIIKNVIIPDDNEPEGGENPEGGNPDDVEPEEPVNAIRYVSLGDSIAAGHMINDDWESNYGTRSQYGEDGNTYTVIVPDSYTDLIRNALKGVHTDNTISTTSFAHSGDTVADLINKLSHEKVRNEIAKANYVTVCIGANDILGCVSNDRFNEYVNSGSLSSIEAEVEANFAILNDDTSSSSYTALFNKLAEINPEAKYVFTTIYNPYKYLWLDEGKNGFFKPLLNSIPELDILGLDVDNMIKDGLLSTDEIQLLFDRVNGLSDWTERYINRLNQVLKNKINSYKAINNNFSVAESKVLFESFPDRPVSASIHYNDLVNVEFTKGYDVAMADWGQLYEGTNALSFWVDLSTKYVSLSGIDMSGLANELIPQIVEKVVMPDVDPHPESYGQYVMSRAISNALGWSSSESFTITFNSNGGSGNMDSQTVVGIGVNDLPAFANINNQSFTPTTGYYFTGWNTSPDGSGTAYSNRQLIRIDSNITLYAQWSNIYVVNVHHSEDSALHGSDDTGAMECYALWIEGQEQSDLGAFSNGSRIYNLPYGTNIGVIAQTKSGSARSYITWNDVKVAGNSSDARYGFTLTSHMDIHFQWNYWLDGLTPQNYWNCYITTY